MSSEGWLLVKDGDVVGRLTADLRRSVANLVRLDARIGEDVTAAARGGVRTRS
jgi:hypothetical protein